MSGGVEERVTAYKVLRPDGTAPHTGWQWPLPRGARRGKWVRTDTPAMCRSGFHGWATIDVALRQMSADDRLFELELAGRVIRGDDKVCASRARLVSEVAITEGYDREDIANIKREFCAAVTPFMQADNGEHAEEAREAIQKFSDRFNIATSRTVAVLSPSQKEDG